jgi:uncharacterized protein (DUF1684 family)
VRLPSPAPAHLGNLVMVDGTVSFSDPAEGVLVNGKTPPDKPLTLDLDVVSLGRLSFMVIQRGDKTGVRLWDDESEERRTFKGREWYVYKPEYVVNASFIAYKPAKELPILNVLGQTTMASNPGYLSFTLHGQMCRLETQAQGDGFFLNFTDATTGKATYGAGRFLDTGGPKDGKVLIDFNRAYSPPCAFTTFATCPLPPKANRLSVAVEAGEKGLGHAH